ncbi:FecR family protein [Neotamlana sedimentorum]|uniref:FecR family protein n=1 Tax=Neotamlana sedimentorum TaxID=1435349 RepID=UPI00069CA76D|nr:FecR family protein [Tamlana sedimentorum]
MDNNAINNKFFQKLIERYLEGKTTADELKLLVNYYESFQKDNEWVEALGPENIIKKRMLINILDAIKDEENKPLKIITLFKSNKIKYGVAASMAVFMMLYLFLNNNKSSSKVTNNVVNTSISSGTNKATLTTEDGSSITLVKGTNYKNNHVICNGEELVYAENKTNNEIVYNYLTIPRGGQFFIKLADGTQVWLNSETKLKYPVSFAEESPRKVELLYGEAYFDVSPSTEHNGAKFIVNNNNHEIEVLGTEFNIKAYSNESIVSTTLVEGKVSINYQGKKHLLLPNQQSVLNRTSNILEFNEVDVYKEISWKRGVFTFDNKNLKEIMTVLSRWYDFDVEFKNKEVEKEVFIGALGKNDKIENLLENLKGLEIINGFEFQNKKIIIE